MTEPTPIPPEYSGKEICAAIIANNPFVVYGKTNGLIDWETRDSTSPNSPRLFWTAVNSLAVPFIDHVLTQGKQNFPMVSLNALNPGFQTFVRNKDDEVRTYMVSPTNEYISSRGYKTKSGNQVPYFYHSAGSSSAYYKPPQTDIFLVEQNGPLFAYQWVPDSFSAGEVDGRLGRNELLCLIPNQADYNLLLQTIAKESQRDPAFFYNEVLPKLFPRAFAPIITPYFDKLAKVLFQKFNIANYLNETIFADRKIASAFKEEVIEKSQETQLERPKDNSELKEEKESTRRGLLQRFDQWFFAQDETSSQMAKPPSSKPKTPKPKLLKFGSMQDVINATTDEYKTSHQLLLSLLQKALGDELSVRISDAELRSKRWKDVAQKLSDVIRAEDTNALISSLPPLFGARRHIPCREVTYFDIDEAKFILEEKLE